MAYLLGYEGGDLAVLDGAARTFRKTTVGMHAWDDGIPLTRNNRFSNPTRTPPFLRGENLIQTFKYSCQN